MAFGRPAIICVCIAVLCVLATAAPCIECKVSSCSRIQQGPGVATQQSAQSRRHADLQQCL
jgi:hypothetical protein